MIPTRRTRKRRKLVTLMAARKGGPAPPLAWKPGQSGNPKGRPSRKPLTDQIRHALFRPLGPRDKRTLREAIKDRLVTIILKSDDKHALKAIEMIWQYMEGKPEQKLELQFEDTLQTVANQTGAPVDWLRAKARELANNVKMIDADYVSVDEPEMQTRAANGQRAIMSVRRQPREAQQ